MSINNGWQTFSFDTMPPKDTPLLVRNSDESVRAAMFHDNSANAEDDKDYHFWFSVVGQENANLLSAHVYEASDFFYTEWRLLLGEAS